jgi:DNA-binding NarL/FixJ family response regulator
MTINVLVACREPRRAKALCAELRLGTTQMAPEDVPIEYLLARASAAQPDVLLLQHAACDEPALWTLLAQISLASAATRVLLLCDACTGAMADRLIQHGVAGCLPAGGDPLLRCKAVAAVHAGEHWFKRSTLLQALRQRAAAEPQPAPDAPVKSPLTAREQEILDLIGCALSNKEIARRLRISDKTVKAHLHRIYVKLNQSGRHKAFLAGLSREVPGLSSPALAPEPGSRA